MEFSGPRARDWSWLAMVSFVIITFSATYKSGVGMGIGLIVAGWAVVNFIHHAGTIIVDLIKEGRPDTYKFSANYQAELIKSMRPDQLKAWRRSGNARIGVLAKASKYSEPEDMVYGEDVSLAFLSHYLNQSTEHRVCPVSNFMAGTYHWDWSGAQLIDDYQQACDCRAYLVRNGWAEWMGNGSSPTWAMSPDGMRWTPEDVKRVHGLVVEGEQDE